jgi:tellurite resistance protein TerC
VNASHTTLLTWGITLCVLALVLIFDFYYAFKNRNVVTTLKNVTLWTAFYVGAAIAFGISLDFWSTRQSQSEFFAGWLTEYSLSFDNLFVLILIMARLQVAKEREQMVLFWGILSSLLLRGVFIAGGAALVNRYIWIFFFFGGFLIYTAVQLFRESGSEEWEEGRVIRFLRRRGASVGVLAMTAIALTNLLFAFDSIPAIFGLTRNPYVIVTATIFVKLIFEATIGEGHHTVAGIKVPEISLGLSLGFVVGVLAITALLSALKVHRSAK